LRTSASSVAIAGLAPITGHLPISLTPDLPRGSGLQREGGP